MAYQAAVSVLLFGHVTALRAVPEARRWNCESQKKAVYHRDDLAPYGFGSQYNHFMLFYAVASLSERIPQEEGPWFLGCNKDSRDAGFSTCWLTVKETWPNCSLEENNKYRELWSQRTHDDENHYEQEMVLDAEAEEWHFDGWPLRYILPNLTVSCAKRVDDSSPMLLSRIVRGVRQSSRTSAFARDVCSSTGHDKIGHLDMVRHVARRMAPIEGMDLARSRCRDMWHGKTALAVHVRRTDKVEWGEDRAYSLNEYVAAALNQGWTFDVVFIATDDRDVVHAEAADVKREHNLDHVMFLHQNVEWRESKEATRALLDEIACLAEADYFIGSGKSNIPWLVQTIRTQDPDTALDVSGGALTMI